MSFKFLAAGLVAAFAVNAHADRPVLGVAEFVNEARVGWWGGSVGWELSGMLSNELASLGSFTIVERSHLEHVLREQDLGASGRVREGTAARLGELTGAEYIVLGTVTSYDERTAGTRGGVNVRGIRLGGQRTEAYLAVDLRVVNATTGELAHVRTIEGRSSGGGVDVGLFRGGFGGSLSHYENTPTGQAIRAALMEISEFLECEMVIQSRACRAKYAEREDRRRERTRDALRF